MHSHGWGFGRFTLGLLFLVSPAFGSKPLPLAPGASSPPPVTWSQWLNGIFGSSPAPAPAPKAPPPAPVKQPEPAKKAEPAKKEVPASGPAKKKTVALLCFNKPKTAMEAGCKKIKEILTEKKCQDAVDFVEIPANSDPAQVQAFLEEKKLPKDTIVLVNAHSGNVSQLVTETIDPKTKKKKSILESLEDWQARVKQGDQNTFPRGEGQKEISGKELRKTLMTTLGTPSLWFDTCGAGGLCRSEACAGGTCKAAELTISLRDDEWVSPPTLQILSLLCNPQLRKDADTNHDGVLDGEELETVFSCDAKRYPPSKSHNFGPSEEFTNGLAPGLSKKEREAKIVEHMKERDEYYAQILTQSLGEYLYYSPKELSDHFAKDRAEKMQKAYSKVLVREGIYDKANQSLDLKKLRKFVKVKNEILGYGNHLITVSLPPGESTPECYWGGMEPFFPDVKNLEIPTH